MTFEAARVMGSTQGYSREIKVCIVIPAKAGIQYAGLGNLALDRIPAFAGMTVNAGL